LEKETFKTFAGVDPPAIETLFADKDTRSTQRVEPPVAETVPIAVIDAPELAPAKRRVPPP